MLYCKRQRREIFTHARDAEHGACGGCMGFMRGPAIKRRCNTTWLGYAVAHGLYTYTYKYTDTYTYIYTSILKVKESEKDKTSRALTHIGKRNHVMQVRTASLFFGGTTHVSHIYPRYPSYRLYLHVYTHIYTCVCAIADKTIYYISINLFFSLK